MNHIYRTVFSRTKGCWIAVSELTKSSGKKNKKLKRRLRKARLVMKHSLLSSTVLLTLMPLKSAKAQWLSVDSGAVHSEYNQKGGNKIALNPKTNKGSTNSDAVGDMSVAVGVNTEAKGANAVSIGPNAQANAENTVSIGQGAKANEKQATAIGDASGASAQSVAVGADTYAVGKSSIAIGNDDLLAGDENDQNIRNEYGVKLPKDTIKDIFGGVYKDDKFLTEDEFTRKYISADDGRKDTRVYSPTYAGKRGAIAIGSRTIAAGETSTSIGSLSFALADNSTAMGIQAFVARDAKGGTAIGERSRVFAGNSVAIGNRTEASNQGTVAYGYNAKAVGNSSIAIGANVAAAAQFDTNKSAKLVEYYNELNTSLNGTNDDTALSTFDEGLKSVLDGGLPLTTDGDTYLTIGNDEIKKLATSNGGYTLKKAENAVVIGNKSFAVKRNSLAVGYATLADADNSFALGSYTYVSSGGINSIGLGVGSYVTGKNSFAGGTSATIKANNSIALGANSYIGEGDGNSNAIGVNAKVLSSKSTALGTDVSVSGWSDNSIVLGNESKLGSGSGYSVIIGDNANIAKDSTKLGDSTSVSPYAIAIGQSATIGINSRNSMAIGAKASIANETTRSIALGNDASASLDNSVALGYRSTTKYFYNPNLPGENTYGPRLEGTDANTLNGYVPPGSSYNLPVDNSAGVISVGGWDKGNGEVGLRRIINVSPGALDTDVATVGQLRALYYAKTEPNMVYYAELYGKKVKLTIEGNEFVPVNTDTGEPIKGAAPVPSYKVKIGAKNPDATTENVNIPIKGENGGIGSTSNRALTLLGSEMVIGNVAKGKIEKYSTDAINGDQLANLSEELGINLFTGNVGFADPIFAKIKSKTGADGDKLTTFKSAIDSLITTVNQGVIFSDSKTKDSNKHEATQYLGSKLTLKPADDTVTDGLTGKNVSVEYSINNGDGTFNIALKDNAEFSSISGGNGKSKLTFGDNLSINDKKLTGLANATIDGNSSDAVTGKQLFALANDPSTANEQGITVNKENWKKFLDVGSSVLNFSGDNSSKGSFTLGGDNKLAVTGDNYIETTASNTGITFKLKDDFVTKVNNIETKLGDVISNPTTAGVDKENWKEFLDVGSSVLKFKGDTGGDQNFTLGNESVLSVTGENGIATESGANSLKIKLDQDLKNKLDNLDDNAKDTYANKTLNNITPEGKTVVKNLAKEAVNVTSADGGISIKTTDADGLKTFDLSLSKEKVQELAETETLKEGIEDNKESIATNKNSITENAGKIEDNLREINTNKDNIATNESNINKNANEIAKGLNFSADDSKSVKKALGETLAIAGGDNITTSIDNNGVKVSLNSNLTGINSIANGTTKVTLGTDGINLGGSKITNLGAGSIGASSTDGINGSQLYTTLKNLLGDNVPLNKGENLTTGENVAGVNGATSIGDAIDKLNKKITDVNNNLGSTKLAYKATNDATSKAGTAVALSEGLDFVGDKNITTGVEENGKVTFKLKGTLTDITSVAGNGTTLTFDGAGISLGNKKITGLADGDISNTSTDAISGKQLHALTKAVLGTDTLPDLSDPLTYAEVKGSGETKAPTSLKGAVDNLITAVNKGYKFSDGTTTGTEKALGSTITIAKADSDISVADTYFSGDNLYVGYTDDDTKFTIGLSKKPTFETVKAKNGNKTIELQPEGIVAKDGENTTSGLKFGKDKIELVGSSTGEDGSTSNPVTLTNLKAGNIAEGSSDAVTAGQLYSLAQADNGKDGLNGMINTEKWKELLGVTDLTETKLSYKANGNNAQSVSLKDGLDFHGDSNILTSVEKDGKVNIKLNTKLKGLEEIQLGSLEDDNKSGIKLSPNEGITVKGADNTRTELTNNGLVGKDGENAITSGVNFEKDNLKLVGSPKEGATNGETNPVGISNLKAGELGADTNNAVNSAQLYDLAKNLYGDATKDQLNDDKTGFKTPEFNAINTVNNGALETTTPTSFKQAIDQLIGAVNKGYTFTAVKNGTNNNTQQLYAGATIQFKASDDQSNLTVDYAQDNEKQQGTFTIGFSKTPTFETVKAEKDGKSIELTPTGLLAKDGDKTTSGFKFDDNTITLQGNGNDGVTLDNVKAGKIATGSKEAINGAQVRSIVDSLGTVLGNGVTVDENGQFTAGNNIGGTNANTITGAIEELNNNINGASLSYKANGEETAKSISLKDGFLDFHGDNNITTSVADNGVVNINLNKDLNLDSVTLGSDENDKLTLNKDGLTVKGEDGKGTSITDSGVTVTGKDGSSELGGNQLVFKDKDGNDLAGIKADGKDKLSLVGGEDGVTLDNLKGGEIKDGSKQAVTGDQVAGLIGKDANSDGTVNNLGGTTANTIDGAISEVNTKVDDLAGKVDGGLSFASDNGTTNRKLGETLDIKGGADSDKLTDNNIGVITEGDGVKVKLAENLTGIKSIEIKDGIKIDENGITGIKSILEPASGEDEIAEKADIFDKLAELVKGKNDGDEVAETSNNPNLTSAVNMNDFSEVATSLNEDGTKYFKYNAKDNNAIAAQANGSGSLATGGNAQANAVDAIAIGTNALIDESSAKGAVALGANTKVTHQDSVAIGSNAQATLDDNALQATSTIASGATVNVIGEVSFGNNNDVRRVTHVADGVKPTDAVNFGQLSKVAEAVKANTDGIKANANAISELSNQSNKNRNEYRAGIAGAVATGSLPQAYIPGKSMIAIAGGTYKGQNAVAVGVSKISDSGKIVLKFTGSSNSQGDVTGGVGVGYQW